ncbi:hypothetical protein KY289_034002 [Solanum tuberosum]|nr:hypothetical protein KY289_034002 [Solanum tuberosum]
MKTDFTEMQDENRRRLCYGERTVAAVSDRRRDGGERRIGGERMRKGQVGCSGRRVIIFSIFPQLSV